MYIFSRPCRVLGATTRGLHMTVFAQRFPGSQEPGDIVCLPFIAFMASEDESWCSELESIPDSMTCLVGSDGERDCDAPQKRTRKVKNKALPRPSVRPPHSQPLTPDSTAAPPPSMAAPPLNMAAPPLSLAALPLRKKVTKLKNKPLPQPSAQKLHSAPVTSRAMPSCVKMEKEDLWPRRNSSEVVPWPDLSDDARRERARPLIAQKPWVWSMRSSYCFRV